jgi:hypothetical protein
MSTLPRPGELSSSTIIRWLVGLASWMAARSLNMPEPLVQASCILVFAHVQAFETRAARSLCPVRMLRQLRSLLR